MIGNAIHRLDEVDSTNAHIQMLVQKKVVDAGDVVVAGYQKQGKGQGQTRWISNPGENLTLSLFIKPDFLPPDRQFYITIFVTLSLYDLLSPFSKDVRIKWPNDMYHKHQKIAGILIENTITGPAISATVIGVGLNVNQTKFPGELPNPTSLSLISGAFFDTGHVLDNLVTAFNYRYSQFENEEFTSMKQEYLERLYLRNKWYEFRTINGAKTGRIIDVQDTGELVFEEKENNQRQYFSYKEIEYPLIRN